MMKNNLGELFFKHKEHQKKYDNFINITGNHNSVYYISALFLLASLDWKEKIIAEHLAPSQIKFKELHNVSGAWSSSEQAIVALAANLFNDTWKADVSESLEPLDNANIKVALAALKIRFI